MNEYLRRAEREAAAIIAEAMPNSSGSEGYERVVSLVAIAWLQGNIAGTHETLASAEQAFDRLKAAL